jgi:hypothetical protein
MVMADDRPSNELESREPTVEDLRELCRELNQRSAKYIVVGGFALRAANYIFGEPWTWASSWLPTLRTRPGYFPPSQRCLIMR